MSIQLRNPGTGIVLSDQISDYAYSAFIQDSYFGIIVNGSPYYLCGGINDALATNRPIFIQSEFFIYKDSNNKMRQIPGVNNGASARPVGSIWIQSNQLRWVDSTGIEYYAPYNKS